MFTNNMHYETPRDSSENFTSKLPDALEKERFLSHLKKAEREIRWIRVVGMASWLVVLYIQGYGLDLTEVWTIYSVGVAYTAWAFISAGRARSIRRTSVITTIGDPFIAAAICYVTDGLDSVFYAFFYFTLLATAFRFGLKELLAILMLNATLTIALYFKAPGYEADFNQLMIALYYLGMVTALSAMMAGWVQENIKLVLKQTQSLREAGDRMRLLLHRLINVEEEERKNISHALHDSMSGRLFNLRQGLENLDATVDNKSVFRKHLDQLSREVEQCTRDVRAIMNELQPTVLEELGFYEAAGEYLAKVADIANFNLETHIEPSLRSWRSKDDVCLFRILQEAILNIRKYAKARNVKVSLVPTEHNVLLIVSDDGKGFDINNVPVGHYGLIAMRERVETLGGELNIESRPNSAGTTIVVSIPRGD